MKQKQRTVKHTFAAMPGGVLSSANAQIAGRELVRIEEKFGAIKPVDVVRESTPEKAPLHPLFTWDNKEAASKWREDEARQIIRSVRIITKPELPAAEQEMVRCFVSVTASEEESEFDGHGYIATTRAFSSDAYREQVLASAKAEILNWQRKYADLLTFSKASESVQVLVEGLS